MALARLKRKPEATEGAGNCAFNAFVLALCNERVLMQIEKSVLEANSTPDVRFKRFIRHAADALHVNPDWKSVKSELMTRRRNDKTSLQFLLAPVLRDLSISIAMKPADAAFHYARTKEPLKSAFSDYRRRYNGKRVIESDDIFRRHEFIITEFERICRLNINKQEQKEAIMDWWESTGYQQFLKAMRDDGCWAGDLELARLARYFDVVLDVVRDDLVYTIHGNYGFFPFLHGKVGEGIPEKYKREIMDILYDRDIIKRDLNAVQNDKGVEFILQELYWIRRRLDNVPNYQAVNDFVNEHCMELRGLLVPENWPRLCIEELIQRNVIGRSQDEKRFQFVVEADYVDMRISAIPYYKEIMKICSEYYEVHPCLVLQNKNGTHWENTLASSDPVDTMLRCGGLFDLNQTQQNMGLGLYGALNNRRQSDEDVVRRLT